MQRMVPAGRRVSSCGRAIVVVMGLAALAQAQPAAGDSREKAPPQGVTDLISVAGAGEIRGAVVKRFPDGSLDVAVQRDWLETSAPEAAEVLGAQERRQTKAVMEALAKRLAAAIAALPESRTRTLGLLRREADRVDGWLSAAEQAGDRDAAARSADEGGADRPIRPPAARRGESQFTLLRIGPKRVKTVRPSGQDAQRIARWAWSERLEDVEGRSAADLTKELQGRGIDPLSPPPGLGDRLPPLPQDDREWAARMALVEDALGDAVAFQGFGDTVVKAGEAEGGLAGLLPQLGQLLGGGNGALGGLGLDEILGGLKGSGLPGAPAIPPPTPGGANPAGKPAERWLVSARAQAADVGHYRATRVNVDAANGRAEVESVFEVRMADGSWETIWREVRAADAARANDAAVERITADERISGLLQTIRGIGLVNEASIMQAIRVGAATSTAQGEIDTAFNDYRSRHIQRLDGPPLRWDGR
ncbi:MAG: hypothetical protein EXS06_12045 [Planctomycetaceae bacterium]|nr:hypothetical protein [Planctomycetaceae bacterium]